MTNSAPAAPIQSPAAGLPSRVLAHQLLTLIVRQGQSFNDALVELPQMNPLAERDRAFVRLLVLLTLRRMGQIDAALAQHINMKNTPPAVVDILRLTAAQLWWLKTPAHAAVDSAVNLAEKRGQVKLKGLVNAVSRKLSAQPVPADNPAQILPQWLLQSWTQAYGAETVASMVRAQMMEPALDITVKSDAAGWAEKLQATVLPTGSLRREAGRVDAMPGFDEGAWWVQDAAAVLPAKVLMHMLGDVRGKTIVDIGAAPGGKTAQLAAAGAKVIAVERNPDRAKLLRENLNRLKLEAEIVVADATQWKPSEPVDAVLLDAPCSATGTLRRHPEIAWLKSRLDVLQQAKLQAALLRHVAGWLPPSGLLLYAVCSLQPEEGEQQVNGFLAQNRGLSRVPVTPALLDGQTGWITPAGDLRTLPHQLKGGMDGFYAAALRKKA